LTLRQQATWFALALILFGVPLYLGLGRSDLENDEAIYSYAVNRALDTHEWLTPRGIYDDGPFLEKPPLKEWIVEAGITIGLPRDEAGLRFFDPLFGILAFGYLFGIGRRLSGAMCGAIAVGLLFTFRPLIFDHGLRSNNMEAAMLLTYCGGMYHFARWNEEARGARAHAWAFAGWFAFGFMTKFVAALFLPLVAAVAFVWQRDAWPRLRARAGEWVWPAVAACFVIAPWFVYEHRMFGAAFWAQIFGKQVFQRFTSYLDPNHLRPWWFYLDEIRRELSYGHREIVVGLGLIWLAACAWRGRPWTARLLLAWLVVPIAIISLFTSKLTHYEYPFLPPLALAGGWVSAVWIELAWAKTSHIQAVRLRAAARVAAVVALSLSLPLAVYARMLPRLMVNHAPLRAIRQCISKSNMPGTAWSYSSGSSAIEHEYYYYLDPTGEWKREGGRFETEVLRRVANPASQSPIVIWRRDLPGIQQRVEQGGSSEDRAYSTPELWRTLTGITLPGDVVLVLPGPYAPCAASAAKAGGSIFTMPAIAVRKP